MLPGDPLTSGEIRSSDPGRPNEDILSAPHLSPASENVTQHSTISSQNLQNVDNLSGSLYRWGERNVFIYHIEEFADRYFDMMFLYGA